MSRQQFEYHPGFAYRFIPGLRARIPHAQGGYLVRVNSSGFRCDHEFVTAKKPGTRRILLFGDSFTAGDRVSSAQRYGDLLERLVPATELYNFGLPGSGTDQHYLIWQEYGTSIQHDLLIIAVQVENIRRVAAKYRKFADEQGQVWLCAKPFYEIVEGRLTLRNHPPDRKPLKEHELSEADRELIDTGGPLQLARGLIKAVGLKEWAQRLTKYQPLPEYSDRNGKAWQVLRAVIHEWVARQNRPALLVPLPLYPYVEQTSDPGPYQARFRELASECGAILHDPLPDLWKLSPDERRALYFENDPHPTAAGHRALAESLAPVVASSLMRVEALTA